MYLQKAALESESLDDLRLQAQPGDRICLREFIRNSTFDLIGATGNGSVLWHENGQVYRDGKPVLNLVGVNIDERIQVTPAGLIYSRHGNAIFCNGKQCFDLPDNIVDWTGTDGQGVVIEVQVSLISQLSGPLCWHPARDTQIDPSSGYPFVRDEHDGRPAILYGNRFICYVPRNFSQWQGVGSSQVVIRSEQVKNTVFWRNGKKSFKFPVRADHGIRWEATADCIIICDDEGSFYRDGVRELTLSRRVVDWLVTPQGDIVVLGDDERLWLYPYFGNPQAKA